MLELEFNLFNQLPDSSVARVTALKQSTRHDAKIKNHILPAGSSAIRNHRSVQQRNQGGGGAAAPSL